MLDQTVGLFENVSYNDMIQMIKGKLSKFSTPISSSNRNKTKQTVINGITCHDITIEDVPALLLQISAFNTNMYDGYFEANEKIQITKDNKIGSDTNYVLLYPRIKGLSAETYTCYFLLLVYEDPPKDNGEVCRLAKIVVNKILEIPIQNIKMPMIFDELKDISTIPELQIKYRSISDAENDVDLKYREYLCTQKLEKKNINLTKNFTTVKNITNYFVLALVAISLVMKKDWVIYGINYEVDPTRINLDVTTIFCAVGK